MVGAAVLRPSGGRSRSRYRTPNLVIDSPRWLRKTKAVLTADAPFNRVRMASADPVTADTGVSVPFRGGERNAGRSSWKIPRLDIE